MDNPTPTPVEPTDEEMLAQIRAALISQGYTEADAARMLRSVICPDGAPHAAPNAAPGYVALRVDTCPGCGNHLEMNGERHDLACPLHVAVECPECRDGVLTPEVLDGMRAALRALDAEP
jgi:hypothetical protein